MRHSTRLVAVLGIAILLLATCLQGSDVFQQRWQRWEQQSVQSAPAVENVSAADLPAVLDRLLSPAAADVKINNEDGSASFTQQFSDIVYFPDGKGVAVWEDERNGDWDVYGQILTAEGLPSGANVRLIFDSGHSSQRQPHVAVNAAGKLAVVWVEGETASVYAMMFNSSLTALSSRVKLNDNLGTNVINVPAITSLADGRFAVVWDDSRNGANIFGQIIEDTASRIGSNFQVNSSVISPYRIAADVGGSSDTTFAVVWEDARDGSKHVYFRILKNDGTPLYPDLLLEADHPTAYQFNPQVEYLRGTGYLAGWISTRGATQKVYTQVISTSSTPLDTSIHVSGQPTSVCWDLRMTTSPDSGAGCVWASYDSTAAIIYQKISKQGTLSGGNLLLQDNLLLGERGAPALAFRPSGLNAVWTDARNGNSDIIQQRLDAANAKIGNNLLLNDDLTGSQQYTPDITRLPQGANAIVWRDNRNDAGDIYLQRVNSSGGLFGSAVRINDDPGRNRQSNPRIGAATNGDMVVVWEDDRMIAGLSGQKIMAQRLTSGGVKVGGNFVVNDDGTSQPKSQPDVSVSGDGSFAIVWVDERNTAKQIYLQRYNTSGISVGSNQLVAAAPRATESFTPHVGMRGDGSVVVSFMSIVGGRQTLYFQRFSSSGAALGDPHLLDVDTSQVTMLDADIFVHDFKGSFYLATIQSSAAGSVVKWHRYGLNGNLELGDMQVSDVSGAAFADLRTNGDIDDGIVVTWSDLRSGSRRGYFQMLREDGFHLGVNTPISTGSAAAVERQPAAVLNNGYVFSAWIDNRNAVRGYDVFLNFDQYTSTDVGDVDVSLPRRFDLEQNFPNPFNPETVIRYSLRVSQLVRLTIFNALGQQVRVLVDDHQTPGSHAVTWDGTSGSGAPVASGIYFYRLQTGDLSETRKMTLLK